MALDLSFPPGPPLRQLEWPEGCKVDLKIQREIERDWAEQQEPAQRQRDELAELRSQVAALAGELAALRRDLATERANRRRADISRHAKVFGGEIGKLRAAGIRVPENAKDSDKVYGLAGAVDALQDIILGPREELPKIQTKEALAAWTPNIVKLIRGHACTKEIGNRIAALEARPVYVWKGPHVEGVEHSPGHLVQRSGNVWLCVATTTGVPGKCEDFALFVRSGRDGRDVVRKEPTLA